LKSVGSLLEKRVASSLFFCELNDLGGSPSNRKVIEFWWRQSFLEESHAMSVSIWSSRSLFSHNQKS